VTGFVVEDEKEAVAAAHRLSRLCRGAIRRRFEERFTARRMAREYLVVYRSLIDRHCVHEGRLRGHRSADRPKTVLHALGT
jgi:hypothetical protein